MGYRLSRIATRTGDQGTTGLGDGSRVDKDALRIQAMGDVDELNSTVGLLRSESIPALYDQALLSMQHDLFDLGGELSIPGWTAMTPAHVARLDAWLDRWNADLPALTNFILPGGSRAAAIAHLARTVARRAERSIVALGKSEPVSDAVRQYINRLSDLMFVLSRCLNRAQQIDDVLWDQQRPRDVSDPPA